MQGFFPASLACQKALESSIALLFFQNFVVLDKIVYSIKSCCPRLLLIAPHHHAIAETKSVVHWRENVVKALLFIKHAYYQAMLPTIITVVVKRNSKPASITITKASNSEKRVMLPNSPKL